MRNRLSKSVDMGQYKTPSSLFEQHYLQEDRRKEVFSDFKTKDIQKLCTGPQD